MNDRKREKEREGLWNSRRNLAFVEFFSIERWLVSPTISVFQSRHLYSSTITVIRHRFSAKANRIRWPKAYLNLWIASTLSRYSKNFLPRVHFFLFSLFSLATVWYYFPVRTTSIKYYSRPRTTEIHSNCGHFSQRFDLCSPFSATTAFFLPFFT